MAAGVSSDHSARHRHPRRGVHRARRDPDRGHDGHHALRDSVQGHALPKPSRPEGGEMTASAGAATHAHQELGTAWRGETAGAQASIVIVFREPGAREIIHRELSKRYGTDYQ